ncbi:MAG: hypothetical protein U0S36_14830 [Candidatus Nanopelagicales bacterium]
MVPTVRRGLRLAMNFWSIETAGEEALDEVDVRLVHLAEELAGVRREALDVAALALGEDRVERQRRLAGPGQPREDDHRVAREVGARAIARVVLSGATDDEAISHGCFLLLAGAGRRSCGLAGRRARLESGRFSVHTG